MEPLNLGVNRFQFAFGAFVSDCSYSWKRKCKFIIIIIIIILLLLLLVVVVVVYLVTGLFSMAILLLNHC